MTEEFDQYATPTSDIWQQNSRALSVPWTMVRALECDKRIAEEKLRIAENVLDIISQSGTLAGILAQDAQDAIEQVGK